MKVGIAGTGTWATALAQVLVDNGHDVILYGREKTQVDDINNSHQNTFYFGSSVYLDTKIQATESISDIVLDVDLILLSVPTNAIAEVLLKIVPYLNKKTIIVNTAKGFDPDTRLRMSETIRHIVPKQKLQAVVSLLGPSHAEEVILRNLTLITAVSRNKASFPFSVFLIPKILIVWVPISIPVITFALDILLSFILILKIFFLLNKHF